MPTVSRFYLHDAATTVSGTLPGSGTLSSTSSSVSVTGSGTNRSMDGSLGSGQASVSWTTLNNQSAQPTFTRRFISDPLGVNSFGSGSLLYVIGMAAVSGSNTNSRVTHLSKVWLWRPTTGAVVATLLDSNADEGTPSTTSETWRWFQSVLAGPIATGTSSDGDVLVVELWRGNTTQAMSTAYTNSHFYDGTNDAATATHNSTTSNAGSAVWFAVDTLSATSPTPVEMSSGAPPAAADPYPYIGGGYYGGFARLRRLWQGWRPRRDGLLVPPGLRVPGIGGGY